MSDNKSISKAKTQAGRYFEEIIIGASIDEVNEKIGFAGDRKEVKKNNFGGSLFKGDEVIRWKFSDGSTLTGNFSDGELLSKGATSN